MDSGAVGYQEQNSGQETAVWGVGSLDEPSAVGKTAVSAEAARDAAKKLVDASRAAGWALPRRGQRGRAESMDGVQPRTGTAHLGVGPPQETCFSLNPDTRGIVGST